ncbi:MAG: riboflavin synthase subunit alpha [Nitrospirae bacterium 13_1_40CM_3_62_11]|nr:MAG: riboflavin synthase subunit alpha [Nitrospirae bacterium 13_1_40CM_3_62_11]
MFTGIVEEMGVIKRLEKSGAGTTLTILASTVMDDLEAGASVSVNGACLTVVSVGEREFAVEVSRETLAVTTLGQLAAGTPVNLERAMRVHDRIGGHLAIVLTIEAPREVLRYCVHKGSITLDGISMTINEVSDRNFSVAVIPHTAKATTLGLKKPGETVNLEADLIGKYVERLLQDRGQLPAKPAPVIDRDYLQKHGLI